jgi:hypothetical protein
LHTFFCTTRFDKLCGVTIWQVVEKLRGATEVAGVGIARQEFLDHALLLQYSRKKSTQRPAMSFGGLPARSPSEPRCRGLLRYVASLWVREARGNPAAGPPVVRRRRFIERTEVNGA